MAEMDKEYEQFFQDIVGIIEQYKNLGEQAYYAYLGPVEQLCRNKNATENEVGLMLDYLLDFCDSDKVLMLYKKVCRTFIYKYPKAIQDYIRYYFETYEPEKLEGFKEEDLDG